MTIKQISAAVYNNVVTGLAGITSNPKISLEQLEDEVIAERNIIIKEYLLKGFIDLSELYFSINCIPVECNYVSKCDTLQVGQKALHFEIPRIFYINGIDTIKFLGSVDKHTRYKIYTDESYRYHQYKKHRSNKPYVYIDMSINTNGYLDCYIYNLDYVKSISITALFMDPRDLTDFGSCENIDEDYMHCGLISNEIIKRLTEKYVRWYKQLASPPTTNNQIPT